MLFRLTLFVLLLSFGAKSVWAGGYQDCPPYFAPDITTLRLYEEPRLDTSLDIKGIDYMSSQANYNKGWKERLPAGLTMATQQLDTNYEITSRAMPNGIVCAQISKLELRFGFTNTVVFVARELPRNSCGYKEVLTHEEQHVAANARLLDLYLPHLKNLMPSFLEEVGVVRAGSEANAQQRIKYMIDEYMNRLSANMATVYNHEQSKIDTDEEYDRLSYVCEGQVGRLVTRRGETPSYPEEARPRKYR